MDGVGCFDGSEYPGVSNKLANESAAPPPDVVVKGTLDDMLVVGCVCCRKKSYKEHEVKSLTGCALKFVTKC